MADEVSQFTVEATFKLKGDQVVVEMAKVKKEAQEMSAAVGKTTKAVQEHDESLKQLARTINGLAAGGMGLLGLRAVGSLVKHWASEAFDGAVKFENMRTSLQMMLQTMRVEGTMPGLHGMADDARAAREEFERLWAMSQGPRGMGDVEKYVENMRKLAPAIVRDTGGFGLARQVAEAVTVLETRIPGATDRLGALFLKSGRMPGANELMRDVLGATPAEIKTMMAAPLGEFAD